MPKAKTKKAAVKRIKVTSTGKLLRGHQMASHLKLKKTKAARRRYRKDQHVSKADQKRIGRMI